VSLHSAFPDTLFRQCQTRYRKLDKPDGVLAFTQSEEDPTRAVPACAKEFLVTSWSKGLLSFPAAFRVTGTSDFINFETPATNTAAVIRSF
jgi:hypothetical protein